MFAMNYADANWSRVDKGTTATKNPRDEMYTSRLDGSVYSALNFLRIQRAELE